MTAMTLIVQSKRRAAYLIGDSAITDTGGRVLALQSKLIQLARFPAVIGITGSVDTFALGAELHAADPRNLTGLIRVLPGCLRRAIDRTQTACLTPSTTIVGLLKVAAWSARAARPIGYVLCSDPALAAAMGGAEWQVYEATSSLSAAEAPAHLFQKLTDCENPALFDPELQAFDLVQYEREASQLCMTPGAAGDVYRIGGGVQLAKVTRRGVSITPMGEWPDQVGTMIDPARTPASWRSAYSQPRARGPLGSHLNAKQ